MKKHFNKELVMTKKDNKDFENSTKCCNCDTDYIANDNKVRGHCHITRKYRGSEHSDCISMLNCMFLSCHVCVSE